MSAPLSLCPVIVTNISLLNHSWSSPLSPVTVITGGSGSPRSILASSITSFDLFSSMSTVYAIILLIPSIDISNITSLSVVVSAILVAPVTLYLICSGLFESIVVNDIFTSTSPLYQLFCSLVVPVFGTISILGGFTAFLVSTMSYAGSDTFPASSTASTHTLYCVLESNPSTKHSPCFSTSY